MRKDLFLGAFILLALIIGIGTFSIVGASNNSSGNLPETTFLPPDKQTAVGFGEAVHATDSALPQATKSNIVKSFSLPESCPGPTPVTGITVFRFGPFPDGRNLVNWATAVGSTGDYYNIWAGAPADSPQKGLLRVKVVFSDSCKSLAEVTPNSSNADYITDKGPLTITKIVGDTVTYDIAGGGTGLFNFVSGEFLK
jgi:hypothetical protein